MPDDMLTKEINKSLEEQVGIIYMRVRVDAVARSGVGTLLLLPL